MSERIIAASAAPYDGYAPNLMLESVAKLGFSHVEPAFIVGYTDPFSEDAFSESQARAWRRSINGAGLKCHAMSSHIDLSADEAVEIFSGRMEFAANIGARIIVTNAAPKNQRTRFLRNISTLVDHAEKLDLTIALENPGDGSESLINTAIDGINLIGEIGSPRVGLNYDAANTASHRPELTDFGADGIVALPASVYAHIKDVRRTQSGWEFVPVGDGDVGCDRLLSAIAKQADLPISIEIPMRLQRDKFAKPIRNVDPVAISRIEEWLSKSLSFVKQGLTKQP